MTETITSLQSSKLLGSEVLTILFFGKCGVGKSSTLNKLFNLDWATDDAVACTKEPQWTSLDLSHPDYNNISYKEIRVVDMPGIGESLSADEAYLSFYEEWIPKADSLVWVTQADTRAYKRDQLFLLKLSPLFRPSLFLTIALNKIDYLGVDEGQQLFNTEQGIPSEDQLKRLPEKIDDIYSIFSTVVDQHLTFEKNQIVPYTSIYGWGLQDLKTKIITRS
jgi:predicted GTPase